MKPIGDDERRKIEELLPWYAAGTLSGSDLRRVEDAIANDAELARSYELIREELSNTVHLNETLGAPPARAMDRLFAKIDAEPARRQIRSSDILERLSLFLTSLSPRTLAWSASAVAFVFLLQIGVLGGVLLNRQTTYVTASAPETTTATGAFALIRFAPQASAAEIAQLLETNKISIADGPLPGGLYRVRAAGAAKEELAKIIEKLQQDKAVSFVAPTE
jgi:anti-sigma factor RsiW